LLETLERIGKKGGGGKNRGGGVNRERDSLR